MKNTWKKTLAGLLAITLVAGAMPANVGGFLTGGKAIVAFAADGLEDIEDYPQSDSSDYISYNKSSSGFDVKGKDSDGNDIPVSFDNAGFSNFINVSNELVENLAYNANQMINNLVLGKVYTYDGVQIRITPRISNDGKSVIVNYELANTNDSVKYVKLGSACDTALAGYDRCAVAFTGSGIRMTYNNLKFNVALNDKAASGSWVGLFWGDGGIYLEHIWDNGNDYTSESDSACAWHWDYTLQPGQVISTNARISAGDFFILDYDTDGGTNIAPILFTNSTVPEEPATPVKENCKFLGWYADAERTIPFEFGDAVTQDTTIYAKWEEHEANWSGRVMDDATAELLITEDGNWKNAVTGAVLHADDVCYYGDYPTNADVTITKGYENVVSVADVYFSNSEGTKITRPVVGEKYFVTAKVNVDQNAKVDEPNKDLSVLYLTKEVNYEPRPLNQCKIYYKNADGEKVLVNPNEDGKYDIPYFTFNGEEQAPEIVIENDVTRKTTDGLVTETETLTLDTEYSVKGEEGSCTKASSVNDYWFGYAASEEVDGKLNNYSGEADFNWGIDSVSADITVEAKDNVIYDALALDATDFEFSGDNADILDLPGTTITIEPAEGYDLTSAGDQVAVITITSSNFNKFTANVPIHINKRNVTVTPDADQSMIYSSELPNITYTVEQAKEASNTGVLAKDAAAVAEFINPANLPQVLKLKDFDTTNRFANNVGTYNYDVNAELVAAAAAAVPVVNNYELIINDGDEVFTIEPKDIASESVQTVLDNNEFTYDGSTKMVAVADINDDEYPLVENRDFTIGGTTQHLYPGVYRVQISGQGNYTGIAYANWKINSINGGASLDVLDNGSKVYDGVAIDKMITVNVGDIPADKATVSTVYKDSEGNVLDDVPVNAGEYTAEVTISAKGYTTQTLITDITVSPKPVTITGQLEKTNIIYTDDAPAVTGWDFDGIIDDDKDDFLENTDIIWTATGNTYTGEVETSDIFDQNYDFVVTPITFTIDAKDINSFDVTVAYTEKAVLKNGVWTTCDDIVVTDTKTGKPLVEGEDYTVNGNTSKTTGNFTIELIGINNYTGVKEIPWDVVTSPEDAAISKIVNYQTYDDEGRVSFVVNNTYEGDKATKYGVLIYRDEEPLAEDLTVNTEKAVNTEFTQPLATFRAKDIGNGINVRPYMIIEDEYVYGNQVNVDYEALKEAEALAAARTEIIATSNYDNEGRITFAISNVYSGTEEVKYGVLITRDEEIANEELTFENAEVNSKFDFAVATFRAKDLGEGVTVKPYMIIGDTIVFGNQFTAYNTPQV